MPLLQSLWNVVVALSDLLVVLLQSLLPWLALIAWLAFWMFAVDWKRLYPVLMKGGLVGVVLVALMAVLACAAIAVPPDGVHHLFGLKVSNVVGKFVYVTGLLVIAILCGTVQLSGCCSRLCCFEEPVIADESHTLHH